MSNRVGITIPLLVAMVVVWVAVIIAFTAFAASSRTPATPSPAARTGAIPERVKPMPASPVVARTQALGAMLATASGSVLTRGLASWMPERFGADYLAMRLPRGTLVTICGAGGCWDAVVNDYGPSQRIHPDRIADIAVVEWERICDRDRSRGLCVVTVTHGRGLAGPSLPETHTLEGETP